MGTDFFAYKGDTNFCKSVTVERENHCKEKNTAKSGNGFKTTAAKSKKGVKYNTQKGRASVLFEDPPRIIGQASVVGKKESEGPLGTQFDQVIEDDLAGQDCWEMAESAIQVKAAELAIQKAGVKKSDIRYLFSGDLLGQLIATSFGTGSLEIPMFGLYGACSTMGEAMSLGAMVVHGRYADRVLAMASSHFATAEKEFRFPLAYGNQRPFSSTWTVTGCGAVVIEKAPAIGKKEKEKSESVYRNEQASETENGTKARDKVTIRGITTGRVIDLGVRDSMNMGAAMAPAAALTVLQNFEDLNVDETYYDRIITGDLGRTGGTIFCQMMREKGYEIKDRYLDCGIEIFDGANQDTHSGGSGCGCSAVTLCALILPKLRSGQWKRVLFLPTGALLSNISFNEGQTIPGIAHAVILESPNA